MAQASLPSDVIAAASEWAATLDGDKVTEADLSAWTHWLAEQPSHREAWQLLQSFDQRLAAFGPIEQNALQIAMTGRRKRRGMRVGLGVAILMMGVVSYGLFQAPTFWRQGPEYQTATGEQRAFVLNDGSDLIIDTQGAVKVRLERQVRHVELVRGQILVRVAKAPNRPFVVETPDGTATALGTRFVVRRDEMATDVVVIESHVRVCLPRSFEGERCHVLAPGERARLASGEIKLLPHVQPEQAALWSKGWLEVDDREVSAVIAELNRYRDQPIRFDPADVSGLRVSGSYPLRDTQRALDGIVASTPLTVERLADGSLKVRRR